MKTTRIMNFKLENGKGTSLSLTYPREDLTAAAMMIDKKFIIINGSNLAGLDKVYVRKVEETILQ